MICAGSSTNDTLGNACVGDSGSALVCNGYAFGIISQGHPDYCHNFEYPSISTKISSFSDWILENSQSDYYVHYGPYYIFFILMAVLCACLIIFFIIYLVVKWLSDRSKLLTTQRNSTNLQEEINCLL